MGVKVKQKNPGALQEILERYGKGIDIAVGLPAGTEGAGASYPDGESVLDVAFQHEFGIGVPERPFLRTGIRKNIDETNAIAAGLVKKINEGKIDIDSAGEIIGLKAAAGVAQHIVDIDSPPNSPATIKYKGSSNPLVNTQLLNQSITHEVRSK
jgi:hypothetical protein